MTQILTYFLVAILITIISIVSIEDTAQNKGWKASAGVQMSTITAISIMTMGNSFYLSVLQFSCHKKIVGLMYSSVG